jgi:putative hydrolase
VQGLERASRYAPTQLARPLSLLARSAWTTPCHPGSWSRSPPPAARPAPSVEISEAWRCPSARLVAMLRAARVTLVPASDARYAAEVGHWQYLRRV